MAVVDDKIADFTAKNYAALRLKHPQKETCSVPDPTAIDYFSTSECFVHNALMSLPNGSIAGLDGILPQVLKDLTAKLNGQTELNFFRALTNLVNVILGEKVPFKLRSYLFGRKLIGLKQDRWKTLSYRCRQYFPLVVLKIYKLPCLPNHVKQDTEVDKNV